MDSNRFLTEGMAKNRIEIGKFTAFQLIRSVEILELTLRSKISVRNRIGNYICP